MLKKIVIENYLTESNTSHKIFLSYELFGRIIGDAPLIIIVHALTGNSNVAGKDGWWNKVVGNNLGIDLKKFSVLAFNIPGNGYDGVYIKNYRDFITKDIAKLFLHAFLEMKITDVHALVGGSVGGEIVWEMARLKPNLFKIIVPIAADWRASDWLIANCKLQENILLNSNNPIFDARMHAMISYRTLFSFEFRYNRRKSIEKHLFEVEDWLIYHGNLLKNKFTVDSYLLMNQILKTVDTSDGNNSIKSLEKISSRIEILDVDSDILFPPEFGYKTYKELHKKGLNVNYNLIKSIYGHDSFLIENEQVNDIFRKIL